MTKYKLFHNGKIYTQAHGLVADSMAIVGDTVIAVGKNLERDDDFSKYKNINLEGHTVIPGFVDSHTHLYYMIISMGNVKLGNINSIEEVLSRIKSHSSKLREDEWVTGEGFSPDRWRKFVRPDRYMLDKITGGRPAAFFSKDQHMMWVNSKALKLAGINKMTPHPKGGAIEKLEDGEPSGILKETPGYFPVLKAISKAGNKETETLYHKLLRELYGNGVTGVHAFDGSDALSFYIKISKSKKPGLRIGYYPPAKTIADLEKMGISYGYGNKYLKISGVKLFADGSLGSQTALCFHKYIGSKDNYGIEVTPKKGILSYIRKASRLGLPCAVHALGDKAISNVLDCLEQAPALANNARHRIEHLQLLRRLDIKRLKKLNITVSMQPSHCPSDIKIIEKYWGKRGKDCFIFNTLLKNKIPLAFGSDAPIEPLAPLSGINAAVNRPIPGSNKSFYPSEKISIGDAIYGYTAGAAYAIGMEHVQGFILPGYVADFIILSDNIYKTPVSKIKEISILATYFDGNLVYKRKECIIKT
jgi:predicted amidohydrolase YtcJ